MEIQRIDPARLEFTHTDEPTDDTERMRRRAEIRYGENWARHRFYQNAYLFTVGYLDGKPEWLSTLQQNPYWIDLGVVGFCRRSYIQVHTDNGITPGYLGDFGEPTFLAHYNKGLEMGFKRFVLTSDRRSKVRSNISRLPRYEELTGVKWYTKDERYMTVPTPEYQYCVWSNEEECYFEKEN